MTCLDMDGVILNYGNHTTELRINHDFIRVLVASGVESVSICTNQGGLAFSRSNPAKYPTPQRFVVRASAAVDALQKAGIEVAKVHVAYYHPKATNGELLSIYNEFVSILPFGFVAWDKEEYRKPNPGMLLAAGCTTFYGDSDEDEHAAINAECQFVRVERFM